VRQDAAAALTAAEPAQTTGAAALPERPQLATLPAALQPEMARAAARWEPAQAQEARALVAAQLAARVAAPGVRAAQRAAADRQAEPALLNCHNAKEGSLPNNSREPSFVAEQNIFATRYLLLEEL
jgi:hypothetical protein